VVAQRATDVGTDLGVGSPADLSGSDGHDQSFQGGRDDVGTIAGPQVGEVPAQPALGERIERRQEHLPGGVVSGLATVHQGPPRRSGWPRRPGDSRLRLQAFHRWYTPHDSSGCREHSRWPPLPVVRRGNDHTAPDVIALDLTLL
jgi:hypothetical protein